MKWFALKKIKVKVCALKMARVDENGLVAYFEENLIGKHFTDINKALKEVRKHYGNNVIILNFENQIEEMILNENDIKSMMEEKNND